MGYSFFVYVLIFITFGAVFAFAIWSKARAEESLKHGNDTSSLAGSGNVGPDSPRNNA